EQSLALYSPQQRRAYDFVSDPGVHCLSYMGRLLWLLGYPDQAFKRSQEALTLAQELVHPFSLAFALTPAIWISLRCGRPQVAQELVESLVVLSREQGLTYHSALATFLQGWILAEQGHTKEAFTQMRQSQGAVRATESELARTHYIAPLAE